MEDDAREVLMISWEQTGNPLKRGGAGISLLLCYGIRLSPAGTDKVVVWPGVLHGEDTEPRRFDHRLRFMN